MPGKFNENTPEPPTFKEGFSNPNGPDPLKLWPPIFSEWVKTSGK